jgi:hypothetical protein
MVMKVDTETRKRMLSQMARVLSGFEEVAVAYVFGSFLTGDRFEDIDVALLLRETPGPYEGLKFALHLATELERNVEPRHEFDTQVLNLVPPHFQYQAIRGEVVFCRDEVRRTRYEAALLAEYLDYRDTAKWLDEQFLARV